MKTFNYMNTEISAERMVDHYEMRYLEKSEIGSTWIFLGNLSVDRLKERKRVFCRGEYVQGRKPRKGSYEPC